MWHTISLPQKHNQAAILKRKPQIFTQKSRNRRGLLTQGIPKVFTSNDLVQQTVFTLHQFLGQVSIVYSYIGNIGSDTLHEEGRRERRIPRRIRRRIRRMRRRRWGRRGRHSRCLMCQYATVTCPTLVHWHRGLHIHRRVFFVLLLIHIKRLVSKNELWNS